MKASDLYTELAPDDDSALTPGCFAMHYDGDREHCAILLKQSGNDWLVVFLTSGTHWTSARCLRATQEDLASGGYITNRTTYLAPVIRPAQFFRSLGRSVSESRLAELLKFFTREYPHF